MNGLNFKHISEIICVWNSVPDQKVWNPAAYEQMREGPAMAKICYTLIIYLTLLWSPLHGFKVLILRKFWVVHMFGNWDCHSHEMHVWKVVSLIIEFINKWAATWQNQQNDMYAQRRLRSAWVFAGHKRHFVGFVMRRLINQNGIVLTHQNKAMKVWMR